jgi:phosphoribosylglycinamide formyltransferase-1
MSTPKLKNIIVFASGSEKGGGSGLLKLYEATQSGVLQAKIVCVVSNHEHGGVREKADRFGIPFIFSPKGRTTEDYVRIIKESGADFTILSGWLGLISGHDPRTTINIHPAWIPSRYRGKGFYGHHVHEAVLADYKAGLVDHHGITMHFATAVYDDPDAVFFRRMVEIKHDDTAETLGARANKMEHQWQAIITNRVIMGEIAWDGKTASSIIGADIEG